MMNRQNNGNTSSSNKVIVGSNLTKEIIRKKFALISGISLLVLAIIALVFMLNSSTKKENATTKQNTIKSVTYEETVTPNAYGNFLAVAVKGFYLGGNTNGVDIPAHNYYPSTADIKSSAWTKQNMQLDDRMNDLIAKGEVVYEPKGCKTDQPSSDKNKCNAFVVKSAGKTLFDSTKKD